MPVVMSPSPPPPSDAAAAVRGLTPLPVDDAMRAVQSKDRAIAALETTMVDLCFSKDAAGYVRIDMPAVEAPSLLEFTPPPSPKAAPAAASLPMELVCAILAYVPVDDQETFAATSKVCRQWYFASTQFLYARPRIMPKNFQRFVATIAPSSTNVKPSPLASLVRRLDISSITDEGKKSFTARLLRRTQDNLEEFLAPQTSFGYICLVALGHCHKLRLLDLSRISQAVPLEYLFTHIQDLPHLRVLNFPRSSVYTTGRATFHWPPRLEKFALAGSVSNTFLHETSIPASLNELQISHCPFTTHASVLHLLSTLSPQLTRLSVGLYIPRLPFDGLDRVLSLCPHLRNLLVAVDYISSRMLDECNAPPGHPLRELVLESSGGMGTERKISPNDAFIAVAEERLAHLRVVRTSTRLGWFRRENHDVQDLVELLEIRARDACGDVSCGSGSSVSTSGGGGDSTTAITAGVWEFESDPSGASQHWSDSITG